MTRRPFLSSLLSGGLASTLGRNLDAQEKQAPRSAGPQFRVAVIGHTGRGDYGHGLDTMWQQIPRTQVVAVADPDPSGLDRAQRKLALPPSQAFADYRQMLEKIRPDIVSVCPRHVDQHHAMCLAAAAAGARGIYIEKPFCRSPQEADEIIAACQKSGTRLAIAHRNRYHPALAACKKWIADGGLGRLLEIRARGKEDARGGPLDLWVLGTHLFNLATQFAGPPRTCSGRVLMNGEPVTRKHLAEGAEGIGTLGGNEAHARFEMDSGIPLFFDSVQHAGSKAAGFGLQLIGNEGVIDLRIDMEPLAHYRAGNPFNPRTSSQPWQPIHSDGLSAQEPLPDLGRRIASHAIAGDDLIDAIQQNRAPLCDALAGRTTIEMVCAVMESHRLHGKTIDLPLQTRVNPFTLL